MNQLRDKKILITGAAGFIGSNLSIYFSQHNTVVGLDNLSTGDIRNLDALKNHPNFTFFQGDVCDFDCCVEAVKGVDFVLHQAALGSVSRSIENPLRTNQNNITGFLNMLEASKNEEVERFIYAASSSTYGDHQALPKVEENIGKPLSPYAVTKLANELYAKVFSDLYGLETLGLRYFNVFGPRQDPNGAYAAVIPKFIDRIKKGETIVVHGDGEQTRDFTYIDNVVLANERACLAPSSQPLNTVCNIAYGGQMSLNTLVHLITAEVKDMGQLQKEPTIEYGPERAGDIRDSFASIKKAKELLGYVPVVDITEGVRKYLNHLNKS